MLNSNIFSFSYSELIFILIIFFFFRYLFNKLDGGKKALITKNQLIGLIGTFFGPFICAFLYTYGSFNSMFSLLLLGALSFFITISVCILLEYMKTNNKDTPDLSRRDRSLLLASLIVPSTGLYLLFLLFLGKYKWIN